MKAFQFPLEKVLSFRKRQWEAESAELASLLERHKGFEARLQAASEMLENAARELCAAARFDSGRVQRYAFASESGRRAVRRAKLALDSLSDRIAQQRQRCIEAKRQYELLDRLRQSRRAVWLREVEREEEALGTEAFLARRTQRRLALSAQTKAPTA